MALEIPGYYYDPDRRKYFRIENSKTAPKEAAWSAANVKRRAEEESEDAARMARLRRHARRVRPAPVRAAPLLGGLLAREAGEVGGVSSGGETLVRAWAGGLRAKGMLRLQPENIAGGTVSSMWIGPSDERSGLGVAYGIVDGMYFAGSYIPRDGDDDINFGYAAERYPGLRLRPARYSQFTPQLMAINFHGPSRKMIVANRAYPHFNVSISYFTPGLSSAGDSGPAWVVDDDYDIAPFHTVLRGSNNTSVHACQPAPTGSRLTCIFGTTDGIAQLLDDQPSWLAPPAPPNHHRRKRKQNTRGGRHVANLSQHPNSDIHPWQQDVLSVDFLAQHPEIVLAGTRSSHVCLLDLRISPLDWRPKSNTFRHFSSVAHVKSVGPHSVLAAGPRNAMSLYDIRFLQQQSPPRPPAGGTTTTAPAAANGWGNAATPIVEFTEYRNKAHVDIGLDVLTEPGYGCSGLVAAAHDDATVGLYSLQDGARIASPAVDGIRAPGEVKSMMWQTLPGDRHPSLFVGEGPCIKKYSFRA